MKNRTIGKYGWIRDIADHRDFKFSAIKERIALPPTVDLRPVMPAIQDQGYVGSCTAHAAVPAVVRSRRLNKLPFHALSRAFVYYNARVLGGNASSDSGATLRDTMITLHKTGVTWEGNWPYVNTMITSPPDVNAYDEALKWRIASYHYLDTLDDMVTCLASRHPFVFGFTVFQSFESAQMWETGILQMPRADESIVGAHAVCAVGYDLATNRFLVRNSWGPDWGMAGHFTMPFDYLQFAASFWTMRFK